MALFDFMKNKRQREKQESRRKKEDEVVENSSEKDSSVKTDKGGKKVVHAAASVLITPHITERARMLAEAGQYVFRIDSRATKAQVADAVRKMYNVHIESVNIVKVHEKPRRRQSCGAHMQRRVLRRRQDPAPPPGFESIRLKRPEDSRASPFFFSPVDLWPIRI